MFQSKFPYKDDKVLSSYLNTVYKLFHGFDILKPLADFINSFGSDATECTYILTVSV